MAPYQLLLQLMPGHQHTPDWQQFSFLLRIYVGQIWGVYIYVWCVFVYIYVDFMEPPTMLLVPICRDMQLWWDKPPIPQWVNSVLLYVRSEVFHETTTFPWCTINAPAAFAWCTINVPAAFARCTNRFVHKVEFSYIGWNGVHPLWIPSPRNRMPGDTCFDDVGRNCACVTWTQMYVTLQTKNVFHSKAVIILFFNPPLC